MAWSLSRAFREVLELYKLHAVHSGASNAQNQLLYSSTIEIRDIFALICVCISLRVLAMEHGHVSQHTNRRLPMSSVLQAVV